MRHISKYHIVITQIRYFFEYYLVIFFSTIIHLMHGIFQILGIINKKNYSFSFYLFIFSQIYTYIHGTINIYYINKYTKYLILSLFKYQLTYNILYIIAIDYLIFFANLPKLPSTLWRTRAGLLESHSYLRLRLFTIYDRI